MAKKTKNPFKKESIVDTLINVGVGGAANVAIDSAVAAYNESATTAIDSTYVHAGKFLLGSVGGSMVSNRYLRAAMDGIAVVGASNLIASFMEPAEPGEPKKEPTAGVPDGTLGRIRTANSQYVRKIKKPVSGVADMMS
ncbi:MAG: hypothetical protein RBR97_12155 [Bacteroidales bacterium]|nr:hypothetical protein [Bacteroidales bacterium]